jgi:hypothetical protein
MAIDLETVTDSVTDAGDLVLDALLGDEDAAGGGRVRRVVFALLILGAILGIVMWRKTHSSDDSGVASA